MAEASSKFVIVANRLPVRWLAASNRWETSPGGLVSAMLTGLKDIGTLHWVGWTGVAGEAPAEFDGAEEPMSLLAVPLSQAETELYYAGMSNATIWPLYHDGVRPPEFHRTWWNSYVAVNERFCEAVASVAAPGATVWVHDYHLQLLPRLLRQRRPDVRIGFFLHIPFPPADLFVRLPFRQQIMAGLLGADLVGLQTARSRGNFRRTAISLGQAVAERDDLLIADGREIIAREFPIGIDVGRFTEAARSPSVRRRAEEIRRMVDAGKVLLGVDRLDYTKGIDIRLRAFGELLTEGRFAPGECAMVQVAEPSRSNLNQYVELREHVERLVGQINGLHGQMGRPAVHYFHQSQPFEEIVAMYLAADLMMVTPLRDGMNLVAKEFVATRLDDSGALVLSEFTGAAELLQDAMLVNPYDIDGMKRAILDAVRLSREDAAPAMHKMRAAVAANEVHAWVRSFVDCLQRRSAP